MIASSQKGVLQLSKEPFGKPQKPDLWTWCELCDLDLNQGGDLYSSSKYVWFMALSGRVGARVVNFGRNCGAAWFWKKKTFWSKCLNTNVSQLSNWLLKSLEANVSK